MLADLRKDLRELRDKKRALVLLRFFKTGKGEYGEGDVFLGITVPLQRRVAKKYSDLSLADIGELLKSKVHEHRLTALIILVNKYKKAGDFSLTRHSRFESNSTRQVRLVARGNLIIKKDIFDFYLKNTKYINNWDLVDLSADKIVGGYLINSRHSGPFGGELRASNRLSRIKTGKDSGVTYVPQNDILEKLARSVNLWERRIAIIATYQFIKEKKEFDWTLKIAEILLSDSHDLIHKAVGWMLREVGKRDQEAEEVFLRKHYKVMPRVMLRYAIERFDSKKKEFYLE